MNLTSFTEVEQVLKPYVRRAHAAGFADITTEQTRRLAEAVGRPHEKLKVIHVAGTSGKTSTCYGIRALLEAACCQTGLTVSPHMVSIAERVQVGGAPLGEAAFCRYFSEFIGEVEASGLRPSYFELMIVFALWVFDRERVDYAVLETGLGGLHDSTNICRRADKVCVITDIGLDHTHVLGATLPEIAAQKAGIIAPANHVLMYRQTPEVMRVIERVTQQQATLEQLVAPEVADFRERNYQLAEQACRFVLGRDGREFTGMSAGDIAVPGRLQRLRRGDTTIIVDGAHNAQKAQALVATLAREYPGERFAVVLAMKQGKEYPPVIRLLAGSASRAVVTRFRGEQDTAQGAIDPGVLRREFAAQGVAAIVAEDLVGAIDLLAQAGEPKILVTGSLYAAGEVLRAGEMW